MHDTKFLLTYPEGLCETGLGFVSVNLGFNSSC